MKWRSLLVVVVVLAVASVCVRLGFWQISRWHEKQAMNAAMRRSLTTAPLVMEREALPLDTVRDRRVETRGRFDATRQIVLAARTHDGSPGVEIVTPLVLPGESSAVLVDRGWLYSPDATTAHPERYPEPGERVVTGLAQPLRRGAGGTPVRVVAADSAALLSARWLDLDTLASRFPYALAPYVVRQLPGPGVPAQPLRVPPRPYDESMHVSYAVQWFLFASILLGGSAALAWSRRGGRRPIAPDNVCELVSPHLERHDPNTPE